MAQLNDLIVTGASRFLNTIQGTASSAVEAASATTAARLNNTAAIGNTTSPVYFNASGVPVALNGAAITVNNATNASKVNGTNFGSAATCASGAFLASSTKYALSTAVGGIASTAARLANTAAIGSATSPVYFNASGVPVALNGAAITVNNATNASKVNGTAFGSLATVSTITSDMLPTHNHTTANITSFNSAVDARVTRDKVLGVISTAATWTGSYAFAEGNATSAIGKESHAEGYQCVANSVRSHAEGENTTAYENSHAEGVNTSASGQYAHAEGYKTTAGGNASHTNGYGTIANVNNQTAIGKYNATVADGAFIIGNGQTNSNRSNAMYVTTAGDTYSNNFITPNFYWSYDTTTNTVVLNFV